MIPYQHLIALGVGYALDLALGDPHGWPHPVRLMGKLISGLEPPLRSVFPKGKGGEHVAGAVMAVIVVACSWGACALVLWLASMVSPWLSLAVESVICYQMLATKSLKDETMRVHEKLVDHDIVGARKAVSMVVGRDTQALDEAAVTRAAVETVAGNASDGVIAPLLFMAAGGAPLGVAYKAVNTMDSMVGYKNDKYRYFGTFAAHLDDVCNFLPARVSGLLMCVASALTGFDAAGAWRVMRRDHARHASPNAGYTEAAFAGALGLMLAGDSSYFGKVVHKPTIGDARRPIEAEDIVRANRLLYATSALGLVLSLLISWGLACVTEVPLWL